MSEFSHPIQRSDVPQETLEQGYCGCESSYCKQHGGGMKDIGDAESGPRLVPWCDPCPVKPEGHFTMDWVGLVCDACAKVNATYCHEIVDGRVDEKGMVW